MKAAKENRRPVPLQRAEGTLYPASPLCAQASQPGCPGMRSPFLSVERGAAGLAQEKKRMTEDSDARHRDLATKLRAMLDLAPVGRSSTIHHLFGILYAGQLRGMKGSELERIAASAGGRASMGREIARGRRLAQYVDVKPEYAEWP